MNCMYNQMNSKKSIGNSNEIRPLPTRNEGVASGEGDPDKLSNKKIHFDIGVDLATGEDYSVKLYNKISINGYCFGYNEKIETKHGNIYIGDFKC